MNVFYHSVDLVVFWFNKLVDVGWFDAFSLAFAIGFALYKRRKLAQPFPVISLECALHVGSGVSIFPLIMLGLGFFSKGALLSLVSANRVILLVAAFSGLCALVEEPLHVRFRHGDSADQI